MLGVIKKNASILHSKGRVSVCFNHRDVPGEIFGRVFALLEEKEEVLCSPEGMK